MISHIPHILNTDSKNFFLIAGPCVVEDENITFAIAEKVKEITIVVVTVIFYFYKSKDNFLKLA